MIKIRLMRIGTKKKPFFRVVVVDERNKRTGGYLELLGTYNPLTEPKEINLKKDRIDYWLKQGAQPSVGYLRIIGKAPQRPPRKPKKESKQSSAVSSQPAEQAEAPEEATVDAAKPEPTNEKEAQANTSDGGSVSEAKADSSEVSESEPTKKDEA